MNSEYENILDHYKNPRNYGAHKDYTCTSTLSNASCGDKITVFLTIKNNTVEKYSFIAEGCSIAIASASLLGEAINNLSVAEVKAFTLKKLEALIGINLSISRKKCASLCLDAVLKAIGST